MTHHTIPAVVTSAARESGGTAAFENATIPPVHDASEVIANAEGVVAGPAVVSLRLRINDREITARVDPAMTLAEVLRDVLGMTGTKIGCDRGACSACTIWLDGEVAASCMTLAFDARGRRITTIEGLAHGDVLHPVQRAFVEHDAMQCGFCTPGMVMSCAALIERNPQCTLADVKTAVSGHLCRCGTYSNVFRAALAAASAVRTQSTEGSTP